MKLSQRLLRLIDRKTEDQRREFRMALSCAAATAEDLNRTVCFMADSIKCSGKQTVPAKGKKLT